MTYLATIMGNYGTIVNDTGRKWKIVTSGYPRNKAM